MTIETIAFLRHLADLGQRMRHVVVLSNVFSAEGLRAMCECVFGQKGPAVLSTAQVTTEFPPRGRSVVVVQHGLATPQHMTYVRRLTQFQRAGGTVYRA